MFMINSLHRTGAVDWKVDSFAMVGLATLGIAATGFMAYCLYRQGGEINNLKSRLTAQTMTISKLETQTEKDTQEIRDLADEIRDLAAKVDRCEQKIQALEGNQHTLTQGQQTLSRNFEGLRQDLSAQNGTIETLTTNVAGQGQQLGTLNRTMERSLQQLESQLTAQNGKIETLTTNVAGQGQQLCTLNQELKKGETVLGNLSQKVDSLSTGLLDLTATQEGIKDTLSIQERVIQEVIQPNHSLTQQSRIYRPFGFGAGIIHTSLGGSCLSRAGTINALSLSPLGNQNASFPIMEPVHIDPSNRVSNVSNVGGIIHPLANQQENSEKNNSPSVLLWHAAALGVRGRFRR
jgi:uncharacterized protein YoxC